MPRCPSCHRRLVPGASCPADDSHAPPAPPRPPAEPPEIAGFAIEHMLGSGGFSQVWAARRLADGADAAIKVGRDPSDLARARLEREEAAMASVRPPHVPASLGAGILADGRPYLAMERLRGQTVAAWLADVSGPPSLREVYRLADATLASLIAVHARGLIHRDLKPENLFLELGDGDARGLDTDGTRVRLIDFGLVHAPATPAEERLTRTGVIAGSLEYMAPEQIRGHAASPQTDLYAFGVVLYELLTLRPPFVGDLAAIEHGHTSLRPPRPSELAPIPPQLERLVLASLAKDPARRPASAAALRDALAQVRETETAESAGRGARPADARGGDRDGATAFVGRGRGTASASSQPDPVEPARTGRAGISLLTSAAVPVVLMVADDIPGVHAIARIIEAHGGFVTRQRGRRAVCAFTSHRVEQPAQAALAATRELSRAIDVPIALHLARATIRRRRRGPPLVVGDAVDRFEDWLPGARWSGVLATRTFADVLPAETRTQYGIPANVDAEPSAGGPAFYSLLAEAARAAARGEAADPRGAVGLSGGEHPLLGREDVLERAQDSARACLTTRSPALFTIVGPPGIGKTRLAAEIALRLRTGFPAARVVAISTTRCTPGVLAEQVMSEVRTLGIGRERGDGPAAPLLLIVDDAHKAAGEVLDRLEFATLDHPGVRVWVAVTVRPNFEHTRPAWGTRANRHDRVELTPLHHDASVRLAAELLRPAEFPPRDLLEQMVAWAGGSPHLLVGLAAELKRRGILTRHEYGGGWHVGTVETAALPAAAEGQWLAARELDAMTPELAACTRVCAVLGAVFDRDELAWVQDNIEAHGGAGTPIDTDVGLAALVSRGILRTTGSPSGDHAAGAGAADGGRSHAFAVPAFRDAVYETIAASDREVIHRHAADYWRRALDTDGDSPAMLERFARHASACGDVADAARAFVQLGDAASARYRYTDADQHYTAALRLLPDGGDAAAGDDDSRAGQVSLRRRALAGRGKARYLIHRTSEAFADLRAARALAESASDVPARIELWIEEATAADTVSDHALAERCVDQACSLQGETDSPRITRRSLMARGRMHWRRGEVEPAIELLSRARDLADQASDHETAVIARLLLGAALVRADRLHDAERAFDTVIAQCEAVADRRHECAAYANRIFLWSARRQSLRAEADLRRVIQIAREIGNPEPEHVATHNLAELRYWSGDFDEALAMVGRARALQQRFWRGLPYDLLLIARIRGARDERAAALEALETLERESSPRDAEPSVALLYAAVERFLRDRYDQDWEALTRRAHRELSVEEAIEVRWWSARTAIRGGEWDAAGATVKQALALLDDAPIWRLRLELLRDEIRAHTTIIV